MNGQRRVGLFSALAGAAMVLGAMVSPLTASAHNETKEKVTICHATNAETNPYVSETVAYSSVDGEGRNDHSHHTGPVWTPGMKHHATWGDIIPPVHDVIEHGLNWNAAGRLIWENHCKPVPVPPPTEETNAPPTEPETVPPTEPETVPPTEPETVPTVSVTTQSTETTAAATTTSQASAAPIPTETTVASAAPVTTDGVAGESGSLPSTGVAPNALLVGGLMMMGFGAVLTAMTRRSTTGS